MDHSLERLSIAIASGISRRGAMKAVMSSVLFAGTSWAGVRVAGQHGITEVAGQHGITEKTLRAFTLRVGLPGGRNPIMHLPDRFAGRITLPGQKPLVLMPNIIESNHAVELSIYNAEDANQPTRLILPILSPRKSVDAPLQAVQLPSFAGLSLAALWLRDLNMPVDYSGEDDCCTSCCWGGQLCGCAVCCDTGNHSCGNCCDGGGCCPGCS